MADEITGTEEVGVKTGMLTGEVKRTVEGTE